MAIDYLGKLAELKKPDGTAILPGAAQSILDIGTALNTTKLAAAKATDVIKNGVSTTLPDPNKASSSSVKNLPTVLTNPMEQFASHSVLWTLAILTPQQFNNPRSYRTDDFSFAGDFFLNNSTGAIQESSIIFSSGGRHDQYRTNTFFGAPEYFINNFSMKCIIGAGPKTGNSNAIGFTFDIIEPQSMGLLLQSMQNAAVKAGYTNYLQNTPYLLRMDIQGYDELGRVIKSVKSKYFTIKLTKTTFSVNEGGSSYKVEAIPYNHYGFSDVVNISYTDVKISGETVAEALSLGPKSLIATLNRNEKQLVAEGKIGIADVYAIQFPKLSSDWYSSAGNPPTAKSATVTPTDVKPKIITGTATKTEEPTNMPMNQIGGSSLGLDQLRGGNPSFKQPGDQIDEKTGIVKRDGMTIDPKERAFQFGQKTTLTAIVNQIILSSDYAKSAITENPSPEGFIKWFKLDVQIELLDFDAKIGDYAKKITYRVVPYLVHQSIFSNPNSAPIGYSNLMKKIAKHYQYIYTGQNVDVLKFDIQIDNLFYTGVQPSPENKGAKVSNQDQKGVGEVKNKTTETGKGQAPAVQTAQMGRSRPVRSFISAPKGGSSDKTTEQIVAENFQHSFLSQSSGDMIKVSLEILGDPYWMVDSGVGNYFAGVVEQSDQITNDGTMNYEGGNIYVYLTFKTPADINEVTGLYDFSKTGKESAFGGIYRVTECESMFVDGQWKQKLTCLRMPGPQGPEANKNTEGNAPTAVTPTNSRATEIGPAEPTKQSPIDDTGRSGTVIAANATSQSASNAQTSSASTKTRTTSNQAPTVVGFRYYRDIGRNQG